jgi:hypothetical protein
MSNDWTGDRNSIFKTMGASNHTDKEREQNDFYATDPSAIDLLIKKVDLPKQILEPACGSGCLSVRLEELGHDVKSYDLVDRGFGDVCDFFAMTEPPFLGDYAIVTNPPYKFAKEFVLHSLDLVPDGNLVCMFLKTTFAEGKGRYKDLFSIYPPPQGFTVYRTGVVRQKRKLRLHACAWRQRSRLCLVDMGTRLYWPFYT